MILFFKQKSKIRLKVKINEKGLICGVSGQDGSYLAKFLLNKGYSVIGTSRDIESNSFSGLIYLGIKEDVNLVSMSMTNFKSVLELLSLVNLMKFIISGKVLSACHSIFLSKLLKVLTIVY